MRDRDADGRTARGDRSGPRVHPETVRRGADHHTHIHPERVPRGERGSKARLTEQDVVEIRRRAAAGQRVCVLARAFGVTPSNIIRIRERKTWAHVP